jgi:hypothetical protein
MFAQLNILIKASWEQCQYVSSMIQAKFLKLLTTVFRLKFIVL